MVRVVFGVFVILHGLVHGLYCGQSLRYFQMQPGLIWPDGSWAFSRLIDNEAARSLAGAACILAAAGFITGGAAVLLSQSWWRPAVAGSAIFSAAVFLVFWDASTQNVSGKGGIGLLINLMLLLLIFTFRRTVFSF